LRAEVEDLTGTRLDLGGRRARRRPGEEFRFLEQRDKPPALPLSPRNSIRGATLAFARRLELELREPRIVGKNPRHVVQQLHGARNAYFFSSTKL
jgi:hypothetical protein